MKSWCVRLRMTSAVLASSFAFSAGLANAAISGAQTMTVDGRLFTSLTSDTALIDASVAVDVKIYNAAANCILYEESQTVNTTQTDGRFTILVGSATGSSKRTGSDLSNDPNLYITNETGAGPTSLGAIARSITVTSSG